MEPVHIVTDKDNIAPIVLLPGDPLRAKYIAEKFLTNPELVNNIRNMFAYTGEYKGKRVTVMGSGMGCPSMGIYSYELYKFYNVKKIIRIGSAGSMRKDVKILDVVLSSGAYSNSNFAYHFSRTNKKYISSSKELSKTIYETAKDMNINVHVGPTITSDIFDVYAPIDHIINECPFKDKLMCAEMEGFALFHMAEVCHTEAAMLATVVDSKYEPNNTVDPKVRETNLDQMITLALEAIIK